MVNGSVTNWATVCPTWAQRRREQGRERALSVLFEMSKSNSLVIPGRASWREPGIHTHDGGYGFRARRGAAPRNDEGVGGTRPHSRGTKCPSDASSLALEKSEGAGSAGCWPHPRGLARKKVVHSHARKQRQGSRNNRHSLRDGLRLIRGLLGVRACLATVALAFVTQGLIPASGDRDRTISPSAPAHSSRAPPRPSHSAAYVRDDRDTPLRVAAERE
jgi:hypothetical protein